MKQIKKDNLAYWFARRLPCRITYWCYVHVVAYATTGKYGDTVVPELSAMDSGERYHDDLVNP